MVATAITDRLVVDIIREVAEKTELESVEQAPPLYTAIDVESLGRVLEYGSPESPISVTFTYSNTEITVENDGDTSIHLNQPSRVKGR